MLRRYTRESLKATGIHDMRKESTISSHVDIPTGIIGHEDVDRTLSGAPGIPLYGREWYSGSAEMNYIGNQRPESDFEKFHQEILRDYLIEKYKVILKPSLFAGSRKIPSVESHRMREIYLKLVAANLEDTDDHPDADRESLKQEIYGLIEEAGTENWDGEGALALDLETVAVAQKLIDHFPSHVIRPDVAATPHGEVDFDWIVSQDVMLTISVCPSGKIAFAGLFRDARLNGREPRPNSS